MYNGGIDESGRTDDAALVEAGRGDGAGCAGPDEGKQTAVADNGFYHHPSAGRKRTGRASAHHRTRIHLLSDTEKGGVFASSSEGFHQTVF